VRFWEIGTRRLLRTVSARSGEVNDAAFAPDGRTLATVGDDGTIKLWDMASGFEEPEATIPAHKGDAIAVRFTPDGRRLFSAGRKDRLTKLWDRVTQKELASALSPEGDLKCMVLAPDGKTLATLGGGYAKLWNVADLSPRYSLRGYEQETVYGAAFSANGARLVVADAGGRLRAWDLLNGEPREAVQSVVQTDGAMAVAFLAGDRLLVSGNDRGVVRLSDATTGNSLATLNGHAGKVWGITASPDGKTFATVSSDGTAKLWDARVPEHLLTFPVETRLGPLAFTPDGRTLIVGDVVGGKDLVLPNGLHCSVEANLEVRGFDPTSGAERFHRVLARGQRVFSIGRLSADAAHAYFVQPDDATTAREVSTGKRLAVIQNTAHMGLSQSRSVLVDPPSSAPMELVDVHSGNRRFLPGTESFHCEGGAQQAEVLAVRDRNSVTIWDLGSLLVRRTRSGLRSTWTALKLSPDATILAAGATDPRGLIELWDINTLELLDSLPGHVNDVSELDFTPDGKVLASVDTSGAVKLWDVAARVELHTLPLPAPASPTLRFSPDGRALAFRSYAWNQSWVYVLSTDLPEGVASEEGP
jgi:WD40 repeat protein